ncbi:MAG: hypothetical protein ACI865_001441 [Flavobacteriaceae bacterium]|jgi:hypothetical protein
MIRVLTFFLFSSACLHGQAKITDFAEQANLPIDAQHTQKSVSNNFGYTLGSVASFNFRTNHDSEIAQPIAFSFFGAADDARSFLVDQRWNEVAMYSILFFSAILNIYLLIKVIRNRQNFTIT